MELYEGTLILGGMRSDGVSEGEDIGSLGDDGVVKGRTMVVSKIAMESNVLVLGEARHEEGSHG